MGKEILLHRQVNPNWIVGDNISTQTFDLVPGQLSSQTFRPTTKDENKLSVYNGEKFRPKESFEHYTSHYESAGVVSVTVSECEALDLVCVADDTPFDGHASIDYGKMSSNQIRKKAKQLRNAATDRGWTFKP